MSKKSSATTTSRTLTPLKRPSTRSLTSTSTQKSDKDKYTFQSDDEDHQSKPVLTRSTPLSSKRGRGRPPNKTPTTNKIDEKNLRRSLSSSNNESESSLDEGSTIKGKTSEKTSTGKKRGRKSTKMLSSNNNESELETKTNVETENIVPIQTSKRRYVKKKTLSTDTNPKSEGEEAATPTTKLSTVDEKDLMQFGSPQHQTSTAPLPLQAHQSDDDFTDDEVEFVWKGSSKLSIEILKRRIPKEEPRDGSAANQSDPTAQRKRAIIPRLTNFDALSGQPAEAATATKRANVETPENNGAKKSSSVITLNNVFQNDFVPSYNDAGAKMTTTTTTTSAPTTASGAVTTDDKPRPRIYAVKSTTMKSRPQLPPQQQQSQQQQQPEIKRPKWMNDQQGGKSEEEEDEDNLPPAGEEPNDYDYVPKGQYIPKRPNYRARGTYPARRGTGMRGRPPGSRRQWHDDDDDDDYDQYEDTHSRYGPRKQTAYRSSRRSQFIAFR